MTMRTRGLGRTEHADKVLGIVLLVDRDSTVTQRKDLASIISVLVHLGSRWLAHLVDFVLVEDFCRGKGVGVLDVGHD
jgi:hypothetical protein